METKESKSIIYAELVAESGKPSYWKCRYLLRTPDSEVDRINHMITSPETYDSDLYFDNEEEIEVSELE